MENKIKSSALNNPFKITFMSSYSSIAQLYAKNIMFNVFEGDCSYINAGYRGVPNNYIDDSKYFSKCVDIIDSRLLSVPVDDVQNWEDSHLIIPIFGVDKNVLLEDFPSLESKIKSASELIGFKYDFLKSPESNTEKRFFGLFFGGFRNLDDAYRLSVQDVSIISDFLIPELELHKRAYLGEPKIPSRLFFSFQNVVKEL
jgi:hypothetical protein